MIAVIYDPDSGRIIQTVQGPSSAILGLAMPFVEVSVNRDDYDVTHRVEDGQIVEVTS
ncbi:MAG TPA: hypothetical protein VF463_08420 [Sphingobium sp.]